MHSTNTSEESPQTDGIKLISDPPTQLEWQHFQRELASLRRSLERENNKAVLHRDKKGYGPYHASNGALAALSMVEGLIERIKK